MSRKPITAAFRKRMIRDVALFFAGLGIVLLTMLRLLNGRHFAIAALVLVPSSTLAFNWFERRAYAASFPRK